MNTLATSIGRPAEQVRASTTYAAIDTYIERQIRRLRIPGAALVIVDGDHIVHQRGFGKARPGGEAPAPRTPFVLGSTTKSFTALAVMQLAEAGKIDLDAPVQRYLPWFRVADPQASAQISVRHLLNQTSGLPGLPGMTVLADLDQRPAAAERQARALATLRLGRSPGAAFEYSNLNYILLGLIIEATSGECYADYVRRHIFAPLQMRHSYTVQSVAKRHGLATGYRYWFSLAIPAPDVPLPRGAQAAGQLISSTADMAHSLIAHLNGGRFGHAQLLSAAGIDELHRGVAECRAFGSIVGQYAMGWFRSDVGQANVLWHGGNVPDFSSFMALLPEQQCGLVLLVNADHYGLPMILSEVGLGAAALLAGQEPPPIKLGFIPWLMRALPLIPLLQLARVAATVRQLRRWQQDAALRPIGGCAWARHLGPALAVNAGLAAIPIVLHRCGLLRFLRLFTPDAAAIAMLSGGGAAIWAVVLAGLTTRALRRAERAPAHGAADRS